MLILAIDSGPVTSGWVAYCPETNYVEAMGITDNDTLLATIRELAPNYYGALVVEKIVSYGPGLHVSNDTHEANWWAGRFFQEYARKHSQRDSAFRISRPQIKRHLLGVSIGNNTAVNSAVADRFDPTGGGANPRKGTKKEPGPLYGIKSHIWSALAVAVTWSEQREEAPPPA